MNQQSRTILGLQRMNPAYWDKGIKKMSVVAWNVIWFGHPMPGLMNNSMARVRLSEQTLPMPLAGVVE